MYKRQGKVKVEVAQVPQKLYVEVLVTSDGHTGRAVVRDLHTNVVLVEQDGVCLLYTSSTRFKKCDTDKKVQHGTPQSMQMQVSF